MTDRPKQLLTQNSELRKAGVYNWTLPAFVVRLPNGRLFNVCPNAGSCARVCYARFGTYRFSNVKARHISNLLYVLEDLAGWEAQMTAELAASKFRPSHKPHHLDHDPRDHWLSTWLRLGGKAVRIHDAGDFFSREYLDAWARIAEQHRHVLFYAYTKEVSLVRNASFLPRDLRFVFSFGGREDHLLDDSVDRCCDVFPDKASLEAAGYYDQEDNDLLAVTAPTTKIGIVANRIPTANKRFNGRTMRHMIDRPQGEEP